MADSRLNGVVRGDASGSLIMDFIPQGPTFQVGEVVLTSGLGGRYPKGIVIGTVTAIESVANAVFQKAIIGSPDEYASLEPAFVPGLLELIVDWIADHAG